MADITIPMSKYIELLSEVRTLARAAELTVGSCRVNLSAAQVRLDAAEQHAASLQEFGKTIADLAKESRNSQQDAELEWLDKPERVPHPDE